MKRIACTPFWQLPADTGLEVRFLAFVRLITDHSNLRQKISAFPLVSSICVRSLVGSSSSSFRELTISSPLPLPPQVAYNTMGNKDFNTQAKIVETRKKLSPSLGYLYPDCEKAIINATTLDALKEVTFSTAQRSNPPSC